MKKAIVWVICLSFLYPTTAFATAGTVTPAEVTESVSVEEPAAPVEAAPAVEEAPVEEIPVVEEAPIVETPAVEEAPIVETPAVEETPIVETPATEEMPATEETPTEEIVSEESSVEESQIIEIPELVGMSCEEAEELLKEFPIEIIKTYEASEEYEEDIIMEQNLVGAVEVTGVTRLELTISLGEETETAEMATNVRMMKGTAFGIGSGNTPIAIDGNFGDWSDKPYSWEYGYDNSAECWNWGVYVDGVCYIYPEGTFDEKVRHKMSLYCDGENIYFYVMMAQTYGAGFSGEDYTFIVDGQKISFQLFFPDGTGSVGNKAPGNYNMTVKHRNGAVSYTIADGAQAVLNVHDTKYNNELELKIPLETLKMQNPNIDLDNIGTIQTWTSHLMYRPISASGADTMPYVWAGLALLLVPVSCAGIRKFYKSKRA